MVFGLVVILGAACGRGGDGDGEDAGPVGDAGVPEVGDTGGPDGGDGGLPITYECEGEFLENEVGASEWVRQTTDIQFYGYRVDREADEITLELLDVEREPLAEVVVEDYLAADEAVNPEIGATLELRGAGQAETTPLVLRSRAILVDEDAYRVEVDFERGDTRLDVLATFRTRQCYHGEPPEGDEGAAHPCAWPVPVGQPAFSVPSCGFDHAPDLRAAPNLEVLEYRSETDRVAGGMPAMGGGVGVTWLGSFQSTMQPLGREGVMEASAVEAWAEEVGARAILGTAAEELLSAAYADPAWVEQVENHIEACDEPADFEGGEQTVGQGLIGCERALRTTRGALRTRRQAAGCGAEGAVSSGDPHLTTFDGFKYDFQGAGEFIMMRTTAGEPIEVQARMGPLDTCRDIAACTQIAVNTAVAVRMGELRLGVYRGRGIFVNGRELRDPTTVDFESLLPEGAEIQFRPGSVELRGTAGEIIRMSGAARKFLYVNAELPVARQGQVDGLWGHFSGDKSDDFVTQDGRQLRTPVPFETLYRDFGASWRITQEESLFDYQDGESTETFTIASFPAQPASLADLPESILSEAEAACEGIREEPDREWCLLDVACLCDGDVAGDHEDAEATEAHMEPAHRPAVVSGDLCLRRPESLAYRRANQPDPNRCEEPELPCMAVFREREGLELAGSVSADAAEPGDYVAGDDLGSVDVAAGTTVDVYYLHLNEVAAGTGMLEGQATFSGEILGVQVLPARLAGFDGALGIDGLEYPNRGDRGVELNGDDRFSISEDRRTLEVRVLAESGLDQLRVIVGVP